jgi:DNA-binding CsgD family transcriptional regulator
MLAAAIGVSRETVRVQLMAVLAKTGLGRQAELANLLSGLAVPR